MFTISFNERLSNGVKPLPNPVRTLIGKPVQSFKDGVSFTSTAFVEPSEEDVPEFAKVNASLYSLQTVIDSGNTSLLQQCPSMFKADLLSLNSSAIDFEKSLSKAAIKDFKSVVTAEPTPVPNVEPIKTID